MQTAVWQTKKRARAVPRLKEAGLFLCPRLAVVATLGGQVVGLWEKRMSDMNTDKIQALKCPACGKDKEFQIFLSTAGLYVFNCSCGEKLEHVPTPSREMVLKFIEEKFGPWAFKMILSRISKEEKPK